MADTPRGTPRSAGGCSGHLYWRSTAFRALYLVHLSVSSPSRPSPTKAGPTGGRGGALRNRRSMEKPPARSEKRPRNADDPPEADDEEADDEVLRGDGPPAAPPACFRRTFWTCSRTRSDLPPFPRALWALRFARSSCCSRLWRSLSRSTSSILIAKWRSTGTLTGDCPVNSLSASVFRLARGGCLCLETARSVRAPCVSSRRPRGKPRRGY
mmetsp:Transcript_10823/g.25174  ORF Transcript_10823/g.25174 Transcript_10823/m.25174 type:complete len:212 (-) Transcript_10823:52-687(-)